MQSNQGLFLDLLAKTQAFTSRSRVLTIAGTISLGYYLLFLWWSSRERIGYGRGRGDVGVDHVFRGQEERLGISDIGNATLGFQDLFVLNMPSRTDRRDATTLAFALSNLTMEVTNGVKGDSIPEEAFPPGDWKESIKLPKGIKGSWRGHMDVLQKIVHENITTAMIFEDDVDWDIRLISQLKTFALASRLLTSSKLQQDLARHTYDINISANPETEESIHNDTSRNPIAADLYSLPLSSALPSLPRPKPKVGDSPYGDPSTWDVLWLGHCGAGFPRPPPSHPPPTSHPRTNSAPNTSTLLLTSPSDPTVPAPKYLKAHPFGPLDALSTSHPPHTRVYHHATGGALCTVAYAVSQRGARRLLAEFGVKRWARIWDAELGGWCAGSDLGGDHEARKGDERVCITVQPPIFAHHHPEGGESNIGGLGGGYARGVETKYVRKSVRLNMDVLVRGGGEEDMSDQWPD